MFDSVVKPIIDLLNSLLSPLLAIVGAVGAIYCVILGVKFAKAEEQQDREKSEAGAEKCHHRLCPDFCAAGGVKAAAGGISAAVFFGYLASLIAKPKIKKQ